MGKGARQPRRDHPHVTIRDTSLRKALAKTPRSCWEFSLITQTKATIDAGGPVRGSIHGNRVLVSRHVEALGFAPNNAAREMIAAVRETGASLQGQVLSAGEGGFAPTIELCLS